MKQRYIHAALFSGLTLWAGVTRPWFAPGLAALAAAQVLMLGWMRRFMAGGETPPPIVAFVGLSCAGPAYIVALMVGTPETMRFWFVLLCAAAILAPVVVLAQRLLRL